MQNVLIVADWELQTTEMKGRGQERAAEVCVAGGRVSWAFAVVAAVAAKEAVGGGVLAEAEAGLGLEEKCGGVLAVGEVVGEEEHRGQ